MLKYVLVFINKIIMQNIKEIKTIVTNVISEETGELIDQSVNKIRIVTGKERFSLVYVSFWSNLLNKDLNKSDLELLAYLMMNYARGVPFNISEFVKTKTSELSGRSHVSYNTCTKRLLESEFILPIKPNSRTYILNPEYAFEGSSKNRKKAIIDLSEY